MKIKSFNNPFGSINNISIENANFSKNTIENILDIFCCKKIVVSIIALDYNCDFINMIVELRDSFNIIFPSKNTITSETKIIAKRESLMNFWNQIIAEEPRGIIIYGAENDNDFENTLMNAVNLSDDYSLLLDGKFDFIFSILLDEDYATLSFNKRKFLHKSVLNSIKSFVKTDDNNL